MRTRAPGKVVLSGAYAVLRGAPALVTAVDRYVTADPQRKADLVTPEVAEALRELDHGAAPWFDASPLRDRGEKLGLGSSAAILVASLGALEAQAQAEPLNTWRTRVYERALLAHRRAQGGGSGIDVAAATFGGTLLVRLEQPEGARDGAFNPLRLETVRLPGELHVELWAMSQPASTSHFVRRVFDLERTCPERFDILFEAQRSAAEAAAAALQAGHANAFLEALEAQRVALAALGDAAGVPVVLESVRILAKCIRNQGTRGREGAILPAGAGGGDISLYVGLTPSSPEFRALATELGLSPLPALCDAPGLSPAPP